MAVPALESAALLNGRYHVLRPVGRGGMGAVYEAIDLRLRNTVAVKQMTAEGDEARQAFVREARLLAALRHGALPVVIDYFIEGESCYLVMQFIEGEDLSALLRRGACSEKGVQRWGIAVLEALVYLHGLESPVIHRDIKPANIKLTPRGDIVLLDFGLAKGQAAAQTLTGDEERSIYGFTPNYASPEQLRFQRTDARSDLYALGATLHHLVTGTAPPSAVDRIAAIDVGRPDPLTGTTSARTVSETFATLLRRAMAIDPAARFASAADMLRALRAQMSPEGETAPARPHGLFLPSPSPLRPSTRTRRVDAATPNRAELARAVDLLVQVRFGDSPLLGLEDWPTRHKPDRIEQASEPVRIEHPIDSSTGRFLPARLRIKLVAPDFEIRGGSEQLIEVPPDEYSKRIAFLMMARRTGFCRVNVEVYAADTLFLGAIAIESEVVQEGVPKAPLCIANLVLDVGVKDNDETQLPMPRSLDNPPTAGFSFGAPPPRGRASVREETVEPFLSTRLLHAVAVSNWRAGASAASASDVVARPAMGGRPVGGGRPRSRRTPDAGPARQQQSPPPTRKSERSSHSAGQDGAHTDDSSGH